MITPTINVNLKPPCEYPRCLPRSGAHADDCGGPPALIPCPLPRSVTFTVTLGECECGHSASTDTHQWRGQTLSGHADWCPARPIRVMCSIAGETWEESEVEFAETSDGGRAPDAAFLVCRDRWALVKAVVLGKPLSAIPGIPPGSAALIARRDAVFAALCKMAKAEEALYSAYNETLRAIDGSSMIVPELHNRPSARALERYVTQLIAKIGAMS